MIMSRPAKKQKVERHDWERTDAALWCPSALVGSPVRVFWPDEGRYFQGKIVKYLETSFKHKVHYDDGDEETLILALEKVQLPFDCLINMPAPSPGHLAALAGCLDELANEIQAKVMQRTARGRAMLKEEDRLKCELLKQRAMDIRSAKEHREALLCSELKRHKEALSEAAQAGVLTPGREQCAAAIATCVPGRGGAVLLQQQQHPVPSAVRKGDRQGASNQHQLAVLNNTPGQPQSGENPPQPVSGPDCVVVPFRVSSPSSAKRRQSFLGERRRQSREGLPRGEHVNFAVPSNSWRIGATGRVLGPRIGCVGDVNIGRLYVPRVWPVLRAMASATGACAELGTGGEAPMVGNGAADPEGCGVAHPTEPLLPSITDTMTKAAGGDLCEGPDGGQEGGVCGKSEDDCGRGTAKGRPSGDMRHGAAAAAAAAELCEAYKHFRQHCSSFKQYHEIQVVLWLSPEQLVGREIRVLWPDEQAWFCGRITRYDNDTGMHMVEYDDGDVEHLHLAAEEVRLQVVPGEAEQCLRPRPPEEVRRAAAFMARNAAQLLERVSTQQHQGNMKRPVAAQAKLDHSKERGGVQAGNEDDDPEELRAKADRWSLKAAQLEALAALLSRDDIDSTRAGNTVQQQQPLPSGCQADVITVAVAESPALEGSGAALSGMDGDTSTAASAADQAAIIQPIFPRIASAAVTAVEAAVVPESAAGAAAEMDVDMEDSGRKEGPGSGLGCGNKAGSSEPAAGPLPHLPRDWAETQVLRPGEAVWAQVRRSTPWPAIIITREEAEREGLNVNRKGAMAVGAAQTVFVRFFGDYTVLGLPVVEPGARIPGRGGVLPFLAGLELGWHARASTATTSLAEIKSGSHASGSGAGAHGQRFLRAMFEMRTYMTEGELPRGMIPPNFDEDEDEEEGLQQEGHLGRGAAATKHARDGTRPSGTRSAGRGPSTAGGSGGGAAHVFRLPLILGPKLQVLRLGEVVWLSRWFHDEKHIYPVGYTAVRLMASGASRGREVRHVMEVVESDDGVRPVFRITPDGEVPISADTATRAMRALFEDDARTRGRAFAKTGADLFGLTHPRVTALLRALPGAERCERFANWPDQDRPPLPPLALYEELQRRAIYARQLRLPRGVEALPQHKAGMCFECEVCGEDVESQGNLKLECDLCRCVVHSRCYGVKQPLHGALWLCDVCQLHAAGLPRDRSPPCELCPVAGGPMKRTETGGYVHLLCAVWTPGVTFGDPETLEPVEGVAKAVQNRSSLRCYLCKQPHGACIQCAGGTRCYTAFHPMCAREAGLAMCEVRQGLANRLARQQRSSMAPVPRRTAQAGPVPSTFTTTTDIAAGRGAADADQEDCKENMPAHVNVVRAAVGAAVGAHTDAEAPASSDTKNGVEMPGPMLHTNPTATTLGLQSSASKDVPGATEQCVQPSSVGGATVAGASLNDAPQRRGRGRPRNGGRRAAVAASALGGVTCLSGMSLGNGISLACFCPRHEDLVLHQPHIRCSYPGGRFANRRAELIREQLRARRQQLLEEHVLSQPPPAQQQLQQRGGTVEEALNGLGQKAPEPVTGRCMSFADWRTRGHRAPEAVAIAREKRTFVRQLPYLVTGRLQQDASALQDFHVNRTRFGGSDVINCSSSGADGAGNSVSAAVNNCGGGCLDSNNISQDLGGKDYPESGSTPASNASAVCAQGHTDCVPEVHDRLPTQLMEAASASGALSVAERYAAMRATVGQRLAAGKSAIHGWGAFAKVPHKRGDMLIEYAGELIRPSVSDVREKRAYDKLVGCGTYIFTLNEEQHIDATRAGNMAHLLNHSCDPNCYSRTITLSDPVTGTTSDHVIITAKRDIKAWEELTYDYRFNSAVELPCNCGAATCRLLVNWPEQAEEDEEEEDGLEVEEGGGNAGYGDYGTHEAAGVEDEGELVRAGQREVGRGSCPNSQEAL